MITGNLFSQEVNTVNHINQLIDQIGLQYSLMSSGIPDPEEYPRSTNADGSLRLVSARDWTSGFFPGALWFLYEYTNNPAWYEDALDRTEGLEGQALRTTTHDLGFILGCSFGNGYRLGVDDPTYASTLIQAATSLSSRFNATIGCIRSWDFGYWEFPVIIDNMMNLELLFLATQLSGDSAYWKKAISHADVTMLNHFRDDFSSYHVVDYNRATGDTIARYTHQGYDKESAWARGQAWGLYGYTMCYRFTEDARYLELAENIARFMIEHDSLPSDLVPYWDFDAPVLPGRPRDVAAAAIMCSALFELSYYSESFGETFLNTAIAQINSMSGGDYTAALGTNNNFILMHGTGNYPGGSEVDVPLSYADYYYVEALTRFRRHLNGNPQAQFSHLQVDNTTRLQVDFDATGTEDPEGDSLVYFWDFGDGKKNYALYETISHEYENPGDYDVVLQASDKWGGSDTIMQAITVTSSVGISSPEPEKISIYPNPVRDGFTIEIPGRIEIKDAFLVNSAGQKFHIDLNTGTRWIPTDHLAKGLYLLQIRYNDLTVKKTVVIL